MTLDDVLCRTRHVLLDFDGPVCAVYGGSSDREVADHLRDMLGDDAIELPADVWATSDPLVVLRFCAALGLDTLRRIETEFVSQEVRAVATATETPGAREAIEALVGSGRTITVVSNNSAQAVNAYLDRARLRHLITGVIGRMPCEPGLMKPAPHLLASAIAERGARPADCVMIGDSASDIEAAKAASTRSIAYVNRPLKMKVLLAQKPDVIIESMIDLIGALNKSCS